MSDTPTHSSPPRAAEIAVEARKLTPPSESSTSMVLNGIGNGAMIGTMPFFALELYHNVIHHGTGKQLPKAAYLGSACFLAAGAAIGAVMGRKEARNLEAYRNTLGAEIIDLRMQTEDTNDRLKKWEAKLDKHEATPHAHRDKSV